jgi:beta-glucosidase
MLAGKAANDVGGSSSSSADFPSIAGLRRDFVWGVSTSSFQIEGATAEDGRGLSVWDTYCRQPGKIVNGDTGDIACDHYHRYPEDIALMQRLGIGAYRFSVAWPRVLPQGRGTPSEKGLAFYDRLIDATLAAGIEPWLCLYHWDMPQMLEDLGGWATRECAAWFADYATLVATRYGDRVKRFATLNEPSIFTLFKYGFGEKRDPASIDRLHRVIHHVNLAHGAAVHALRARVPGASIGAIHNYQPCFPSSPADAEAAERGNAYWNGAFPDPQCLGSYPGVMQAAVAPHLQAGDMERICEKVDWFGLNHYSPVFVKADAEGVLGFAFGDRPAEIPVTPVGWPIMPNGFRDTLLALHKRYGLPIYVLENGLGGYDKLDRDGTVIDNDRIAYLRAYVGALNEAVLAGADVRGYFVWSLLDNFEWDSGYSVRFGLTYVDYPTQRRIPKASFGWYHGLIELAHNRLGK